VDLSNRDVVAVAGPDRLTWLHALTSQDFESLPPGQATEALLLSPQGHLEFAFGAVDDGATVLLHTEPGAGPGLLEFLERMKFMSRVELAARPDVAVLGLPGLATTLIARSELAT